MLLHSIIPLLLNSLMIDSGGIPIRDRPEGGKIYELIEAGGWMR